MYKYTIIDKITDKDGNVLHSHTPVVENQLTGISKKAWDSIFTGMENVILEYSYALRKDFSSLPVSVAAKTGSAQQGVNLPPHAVFVSFAPKDTPEISVITVIPNGFSGNESGFLCRDVYAYHYNGEFSEYLEKTSGEVEIR